MRFLQAVIVGAALLVGCGGAPGKKVVVYTALEEEQIGVYLSSFRQQHPDIELQLVRNSNGIITARLLAEKHNPQADVIWGVAVTSLLVAQQQGLLLPYAPQGVERINPAFRDSAHTPRWVGIDAWMTGIVCNTVELDKKKLPLPRSYADLLQPHYRGLIVMPHPASSGTGFLTVSALLQLLGMQGGWEYLDKLHENVALYTHSGSKPAKLAGMGEYPIGISFGYRGIMQRNQGQPVVTVFPQEGSGWDIEANALINKKEISAHARLFLDWAISDAAMREYAKNFAIVTAPVQTGVPEGFPARPLEQLAPNDLEWAAAHRDTILAEWSRRYENKSEAR
jgi:iron(III) transport system substrate-binding protein